MLTFTIPASLRPLARSHQNLVYDLLFRASAAATQSLAQDPRFVGGQLGLIGILHTWGAIYPIIRTFTILFQPVASQQISVPFGQAQGRPGCP
jgi:hypothetical protein